MFEALLNKNIQVKQLHSTSRTILTGMGIVLLVMMLLLIWQIPLAVSQFNDPATSRQALQNAAIETIIVLGVMVPVLIFGREILENWIQSQSFFKTLFEDSVEPILLYQLDGRITTCNPAFSKMLGYGVSELQQMRFQELIVSDGRELAYLFRSGESGERTHATLALQGCEGQVLFAVAHEQRIHIRGKVQLLTFLEDVTERHIAAQKNQLLGEITSTLLETRDIRQVHQIVCAEIAQSADSLVVLLATFNPKLEVLDILAYDGSPIVLEQFNAWAKETLPKGLTNIPLRDDQISWLTEPLLAPYPLMNESDRAREQFPWMLIPHDSLPPKQILSRCLYIEEDAVTSLVILDYKGRLDTPFIDRMLYFFSTAVSRLATQAQLTRSQMQLSETQQLVKVGRMQYDFATSRTYLSPELCTLCGIPETTSVMELVRMVHPDDQPGFAQVMDQIIEFPPHNKVRFNFRLLHPDGYTLYLRSQSKVHFDDAGFPLYAITAIHDATEIMSARDLLQQRQMDLDTMAKERQLMEERVTLQVSELEHVNKNLNTALMVKDEFLSSMSSNLKAPLTAILGTAELLRSEKRGDLNTDQMRYVNLIERSGEQLLDSINAILDLTKFSLNKEEISQEKVSLHDLCQAGVLYAQSYANHKNVLLQYELKLKEPIIIGDPIRLRQIVTILLKQAVNSARENGTVQLNIFTHTDPQYIWIQILDNGTQSISTVLEPLRHGIDPNNAQSLELEIASRLIELHGGTLQVLHERTRGNTVVVMLPRHGILNNHYSSTLPPEEDTVSPQEAAGRG